MTRARTWFALLAGLPIAPAAAQAPLAPAGQAALHRAQASGEATGFLDKTLTMGDETFSYCVYVPADYTPNRPWPVILFLHGSEERGRDGLHQTQVGLPAAIRQNRARFPAIVVMPQCREDDVWWSERMMRLALRSVEVASEQYYLDPDRIYLTGLSLGGAGCWHLGARSAGQFAAIVPVCGFAELGPSTGAAERLARRLTDVPIWCFHGALDTSVPPEKSREMVSAIRSAGGDVRYTEYPQGGHVIWDVAYNEPALWSWVLAQRRGARPATGPATAPAAGGRR